MMWPSEMGMQRLLKIVSATQRKAGWSNLAQHTKQQEGWDAKVGQLYVELVPWILMLRETFLLPLLMRSDGWSG